MRHINDESFLEKLVIKSMLEDQHFGAAILSTFEPDYFDDASAQDIFLKVKKCYVEDKKIPDPGLLPGMVNDPNAVSDFLRSAREISTNVEENLDIITNEVEAFLKKSSMRQAILNSADIVNADGDYGQIDKNIKTALSKSLKFEIGVNYWETLGERLTRMFTDVKRLIPTYYPTLDELMAGGMLPKTLSIVVGRTHAGKSQFLINVCSRIVMHGFNVLYFTLEMSEDMVSQRFDSVYSGLDINKIYTEKKKELADELKKVKESSEESRGKLFIKEFPTKSASALTLKSYLEEQKIRGNKFDLVGLDYLGLMRAIKDKASDNSYETVKRISEEVRGLSFEYDCPFLSLSQFNRTGAKEQFSNLSNEDIAESYGLSMTMDFGMAIGFDEDAAVYKNELSAKILKNRFGGRVGEEFNFYTDPKSLKMYDSTELDDWMDAAVKSGAKEREFNKKS